MHIYVQPNRKRTQHCKSTICQLKKNTGLSFLPFYQNCVSTRTTLKSPPVISYLDTCCRSLSDQSIYFVGFPAGSWPQYLTNGSYVNESTFISLCEEELSGKITHSQEQIKTAQAIQIQKLLYPYIYSTHGFLTQRHKWHQQLGLISKWDISEINQQVKEQNSLPTLNAFLK